MDYQQVLVEYNKLLKENAILKKESAGFVFENGMLSASTPFNFEYLTNNASAHIAIAEAIQQDLAVIGIDMTIKTVEWNVFLEERKAGNYDVVRNGWIADFNDPVNMLEMWTTESGNNDAQFGKWTLIYFKAVIKRLSSLNRRQPLFVMFSDYF